MIKFIKKTLFNITHWCFNYNDYEFELFAVKDLINRETEWTETRKQEIIDMDNYIKNTYPVVYERGYSEKKDFLHICGAMNNCCGKNAQQVRTSGSSGEPFRFCVGKDKMASRFALVDYRFKQIGFKKGDRFLKFWYSTTGHGWWQMIKEKLDRFVRREKFISYFDLVNKKKNIKDYIDFIRKVKPILIEGYAGGIIALATYVLEHPTELPALIGTIKYIVTGAGMVTKKDKELIEKAFNCKHYDRYGCSEFGEIAHELPDVEGYEFNPWLEIWFAEKKGDKLKKIEECDDGVYDIFVTDPRDITTPFWKYHMKDRVEIKNHRMVGIYGRAETMYKLSNGNYLPSGFFYQFFKDSKEVNRFQVVYYEEIGKMLVRVYPKMLEDALIKELKKMFFGENVEIYISNNFETVGRRQKIPEVIVK